MVAPIENNTHVFPVNRNAQVPCSRTGRDAMDNDSYLSLSVAENYFGYLDYLELSSKLRCYEIIAEIKVGKTTVFQNTPIDQNNIQGNLLREENVFMMDEGIAVSGPCGDKKDPIGKHLFWHAGLNIGNRSARDPEYSYLFFSNSFGLSWVNWRPLSGKDDILGLSAEVFVKDLSFIECARGQAKIGLNGSGEINLVDRYVNPSVKLGYYYQEGNIHFLDSEIGVMFMPPQSDVRYYAGVGFDTVNGLYFTPVDIKWKLPVLPFTLRGEYSIAPLNGGEVRHQVLVGMNFGKEKL